MARCEIVKDVNLLVSLNKKPRKIEKKKSSTKSIVFLILVTVVMGGIYSYLLYQTKLVNEDSVKSENILSDKKNIEDHADYEKAFSDTAQLNARLVEMQTSFDEYFFTRPVNKKLMDNTLACIDGTAFVTEYTFTRESNTLHLTVNTADVNSISTIVKKLRATGLYSDVVYTGYEANGTKAKYAFEIICTVVKDSGEDR